MRIEDSGKKQNGQKYMDLHTHTNYSDGVGVDPELNVRMALLYGVNVLAITDHDHYIGYFKAKKKAEENGIILLPGAELTTPDYHLLALNFNPHNKRFIDFLAHSRELQRQKCELRVQKLHEHGVPINMEKVIERFPESRLGKYNVFVTMAEDMRCREFVNRECSDISGWYQRFQYYFGKNGICGNIPEFGVSVEEAIGETHGAGGFVSLAHGPKDVKDPLELSTLVKLGLDMCEDQINQRNKSYKSINYDDVRRFAGENGMPITNGSDWHGPTFSRPFLDAGENVMSTELEEMLNNGYVKISRES